MSTAKGSRLFQGQAEAPMRHYFAPHTLSFPKPDLVRKAGLRFPVILNIEPSLRCNAHCIMCPREKARRPVGDMDFGLFRKIITDLREHGPVSVINFHKDGEPLMHPRLEEMIALALKSKACAFSHFNTNALLLDEERARALLDCGIDDITMSVDAVQPQTFLKVKRVAALDRVERHVEGLLNLRARAAQTKPWVRVKLCAMPETEAEIDDFIRRWTGTADEVQIQEVHNYAGGHQGAMPGNLDRYPCQFWWSSMAVNWDGTVSVCPVDYSGEWLLGDLKQQSLQEIFKDEAYERHRRAMLAGDYTSHPLCAHCTVWKVGPDQSAWYKTFTANE